MNSQFSKWQPVLLLIVIMFVLQWLGPELFRLQMDQLKNNQWWRLLTGHWVHANWIHFSLNMTGFLLCQALTGVNWSFWQWLWRIVVLSMGISAGFYLLHPEINWYVGFSGVLFGLYVMASFSSLAQQVFMSSALLLLVGVKIILEQVSSVNISTSELIGVPVLVDAHLYGVLLALLIVAIQMLVNRVFQAETSGSGKN